MFLPEWTLFLLLVLPIISSVATYLIVKSIVTSGNSALKSQLRKQTRLLRKVLVEHGLDNDEVEAVERGYREL